MSTNIQNKTKIRWAIGLLALVVITVTLSARPGALFAATDWEARYWNNSTLSGDPVLQRFESDLNYDWGNGSPAAGVNDDSFSARWERIITVPTGTYRFTATTDDGMRVWVDDVLLIDSWWDSQVHALSADIYLNSGDHRVKVQYYEVGGKAVAKLQWSLVSTSPGAIYYWRGEYFNNIWLSGNPILVRDDREINFDWGGNAPEWNVVPADRFSVRWTRNISLDAGRYRFTVLADDGVRLWVNGQLIIDQWHDAAATYYNGEIDLYGGSIPVKMEYYENQGGATAKLAWAKVSNTAISRWQGEYFSNRWLAGSPSFVRDDSDINFNWGYNGPGSGLPSDNFSVRWTRTLNFASGTYRFSTSTDDGVRLWVNGSLLIDQWQNQAASTYANTIYLSGDVPVKMEYYEDSGLSSARLTWARVDGTPQPGPSPRGTVIIDDADVGFARGGSAAAWRTADAGYNGRLTWTRNNDKARTNYNWARWYPILSAGRYEVFVYIPDQHGTTDNARYWVSHSGGYSLQVVDQSIYSGQWVTLGTYEFRGNSRDYVSLSDITYESYLSRQIAFDAMKWEPR